MNETKKIKYRKGYKYQLAKDYETKIGIILGYPIITDFICLYATGYLVIKKGYAWDGASGPGIDTKNILRGSLVHDAIYQLIRQGLNLGFREQADKELKRIFLEDSWEINKKKKFSRTRQKCSEVRAWWVYRAVRGFAKEAALPENRKKILVAP